MAAHLQKLQRSFLRHLRAAGRSPATLRLYRQSVTSFSAWLTEQGRTADLDELTRPAVREWLAQLAETREATTVRTRHRGLRRFTPEQVRPLLDATAAATFPNVAPSSRRSGCRHSGAAPTSG